MANYLDSNKIKMYPSSFREHSVDPESYLNTEQNLTQAKKLSEIKELNNYVIESSENESGSLVNYIIVYLGGYYFKFKKADLVALNLGNTVYAYIKLIKDTTYYTTSATFSNSRIDNIATSGSKLDNTSGVFEGIKFVSSIPTSSSSYDYIVKVLENGNVPVSSKLKIDSSEIRDNSSGNKISSEFNSELINNLSLNKKTTGFEIKGGTTSKTLTIAGTTTINGTLEVASGKNVDIDDNLLVLNATDIYSKLEVGGVLSNTGKVSIKSAGSSATTIVGPNNGTINLPANASTDNQALVQSTAGTSTWLSYTSADTESTLVRRDANGVSKFKDVYLTNQKATSGSGINYGVKIDSTGKLIHNNLTVSDPTASGNATSFIDTISQSSDGKISVTKKTIPNATNITYGLVKPWYTTTSSISVEDQGSSAGRNYGVQIDSNGKLFVYVPWNQGSFSLSPATTYSLGGLKVVNEVTSVVTVSSQFATANRYYGLQIDGMGRGFVNVPWESYSRATESSLGLVKIGYTSTAKNYAVQLSNEQMYVYVPWENTTYTFSTSGVDQGSFRVNSSQSSEGVTVTIPGLSTTGTPTFSSVTATTFTASSDLRKKENVVDYVPEKSILDLSIKKFDFIEGKKNNIGCIAQDLQKICPEIVHEDKDGYLSIEETKLVYLLIDEVKKLKNKIEELERR